ncbi:MAG: hypothetical protein IT270_14055 [Saprospiraceae bacterium]|nr:hypothetical protein [Saprospiraceae bacterium]
MKTPTHLHTTNYLNTFIEIAADCPAQEPVVPPVKGDNLSVANLHFDMIAQHPYRYSSDDVVFGTYAEKNNLEDNLEHERELFFSKGQACLRCSPLTKRYGWGVHCDTEGRVAVFGAGTPEYQRLANDPELKHVKAMRNKSSKPDKQ